MSQINLLTNERIVDRTNTEYYNALRTNIQFLGKDIKVIALTSTKENLLWQVDSNLLIK